MNSHGIQLSRLHLFLGCRVGGVGEGVFLLMGPFYSPAQSTHLFIFFKVTAQKQTTEEARFLFCFVLKYINS